jgi:hypothetical protein
MDARRKAMEHHRSARRWWLNPRAEARRQWNKARSDWYQDMVEQRQQHRPGYGHSYGRGYGPYGGRGPWYY